MIIPSCVYSNPQVASIGLTEKKAKTLGLNIKIGKFPLSANGKALSLSEGEGFCEKLYFRKKTGQILGAHLIGVEVTELINSFSLAMKLEATELDIFSTIFPHPTISESIHESALDDIFHMKKQYIYKMTKHNYISKTHLTNTTIKYKKPPWIKVKAPQSIEVFKTRDIVKQFNLNTVCEEAACPNIGECWNKKHATFMILGRICTRKCTFCNIATGAPNKIDKNEPEKIARAVNALGLKHVVITSVDRDDLEDGGAEQFALCISKIRNINKNITIEILTPDFQRKKIAIDLIVNAKPDVFNHNLETIPRLYKDIRRGANYNHSLLC